MIIKVYYYLKRYIKYIGRYGYLIGTKLFFSIACRWGSNEVSLPDLRYPIIIRCRTTDVYIFEEIFLDECYNLSAIIKPKLIIDAGAYVGYSAIYFTHKFPGAKIIAIEPALSNFELLKRNTYHYNQIDLIHGGIWYKKAWLRIKNAGAEDWGFAVEETNEIEKDAINGVTLDEILNKSGYEEIDLLKLNIEGAEREIFTFNYEKWLGRVNLLIIEFHDRIKPGCSEAFFSAIKPYNFIIEKRGVYNMFKKRHD